MKKLRVALLSGGMSTEREVSIKSGDKVAAALDKDRYEVLRYDPATDLARLVADAPGLDVALVILHGPFGEDGTVQGLLDLLGLPYQGSGVLGSALAMNKLAAKRMYEAAGLPVPPYVPIGGDTDSADVVKKLGLPLVVKPCCGGSSIGMSLVHREEELDAAIEAALAAGGQAMAEAYIKGRELTAGVLGNEDPEALPLVEIIPGKDSPFFDFLSKYTPGEATEICPAPVDEAVAARGKELGLAAHKALFCRGYSRTDMILADDNLYILETNTIPGMGETSLLPQAAKAAGYSFSALLDRLIDLALENGPERAPGRKVPEAP
ncbi:MAG: D-alanine--D-alanine ligase [Deltaproteobacteria bacterium]|nr:D-alanine--D-alanine ligase [Deltaproteobacteria bacterium]